MDNKENCCPAPKLVLDIDAILRGRMGEKGKFLPRMLTRGLERLIHQEELNAVLDAVYPREGSAFAAKVYDYFELTLDVEGEENIPAEGRFIFASNHPLGGLDGIGLISVLGRKYGDRNIRFLVNDILLNITPLRNVFLPINKYGSQGRAAAKAIAEAYASDAQIIIFPAGLVSRLHPDGKIRDLQWQKSFVQKAVEYQRDIIPVRFEGLNSMRFYKTARLRKRLGIKINIEQAMLPGELCKARGKKFGIRFGRPVSWQSIAERLAAGESPAFIAEQLKV